MKKLILLLSLVTVTVNANSKFELSIADGTLVDMGTIDSTLSNYKRGFDGTIRFQNSNEWAYLTPGKVLDLTYGK